MCSSESPDCRFGTQGGCVPFRGRSIARFHNFLVQVRCSARVSFCSTVKMKWAGVALADRTGDWRVSIIGSQANDRWEMKIFGPNAFERSYTLEVPVSTGRK